MSFDECIKLLFDVIRNYGLAAVVLLAGDRFKEEMARSSNSAISAYISGVLMVFGYLLF